MKTCSEVDLLAKIGEFEARREQIKSRYEREIADVDQKIAALRECAAIFGLKLPEPETPEKKPVSSKRLSVIPAPGDPQEEANAEPAWPGGIDSAAAKPSAWGLVLTEPMKAGRSYRGLRSNRSKRSQRGVLGPAEDAVDKSSNDWIWPFAALSEQAFVEAVLEIAKEANEVVDDQEMDFRGRLMFDFAHLLQLYPSYEGLTGEQAAGRVRHLGIFSPVLQDLDEEDLFVFAERWNQIREKPEKYLVEIAAKLARIQPVVTSDKFPNYARFISMCAWLQALRREKPIWISIRDCARIFFGWHKDEKNSTSEFYKQAEKQGLLVRVQQWTTTTETRYRFNFERLAELG